VKYGSEKGLIPEQTNWELVEKRLNEEKRQTLPLTVTSEAIKRFRLSSQVVKENGPGHRKTGLVEQQACFTFLREQK
tara:strand:+ start:190 stop:420 length:231 start_codon:yes stop_codon:yes gene_type:complete